VAFLVRVVLQFQGDAVTRYLIPHAGGSPTRLGRCAPDQLGQLCSCEGVLEAVLGGVEGSCDGADPSSALVPRAVCDWSANRAPLCARAPARGSRPA
jgi:hypothetical protein